MKLDNRGVMLLEQIVSIFLIGIITTTIFTALLHGSVMFIEAYQSHSAVNEDYNILEETVNDPNYTHQTGSISFENYVIDSIDGTFVYGNSVVEFVKDSATPDTSLPDSLD